MPAHLTPRKRGIWTFQISLLQTCPRFCNLCKRKKERSRARKNYGHNYCVLDTKNTRASDTRKMKIAFNRQASREITELARSRTSSIQLDITRQINIAAKFLLCSVKEARISALFIHSSRMRVRSFRPLPSSHRRSRYSLV